MLKIDRISSWKVLNRAPVEVPRNAETAPEEPPRIDGGIFGIFPQSFHPELEKKFNCSTVNRVCFAGTGPATESDLDAVAGAAAPLGTGGARLGVRPHEVDGFRKAGSFDVCVVEAVRTGAGRARCCCARSRPGLQRCRAGTESASGRAAHAR